MSNGGIAAGFGLLGVPMTSFMEILSATAPASSIIVEVEGRGPSGAEPVTDA